MSAEEIEGLQRAPCPDCDGSGCEVCEGQGFVLVPSDVRTGSATATSESSSHTEHVGGDAGEEAGEDARDERSPRTLFGGLSPSEASKARWAKERARQAEQEAVAVGSDIIVRTTVPVSTIIKRLSADAQKGNTGAARELRSWLATVDAETETQVSDLDKRTRQSLIARLLRELEEEEAARAAQEEESQVSTVSPAVAEAEATPASVGVPSSSTHEPLVAREQAESPAASASSEDDTPISEKNLSLESVVRTGSE